MAKSKIATKRVDDAQGIVWFDFADGTQFGARLSELPESIQRRLALHGLAQKLGDSYAGAESVTQAFGNVETVWAGLVNDEWTTRATGGILAEALAKVTGRDLPDCIAALRELDDRMKRKLQRDPAILAAIADIQRDRAEAGGGMDLDTLF